MGAQPDRAQAMGQTTHHRIENLKYQQFIRPHDEVSVELKFDEGKNKLSFKINNGEHPCASGRIVFEAV